MKWNLHFSLLSEGHPNSNWASLGWLRRQSAAYHGEIVLYSTTTFQGKTERNIKLKVKISHSTYTGNMRIKGKELTQLWKTSWSFTFSSKPIHSFWLGAPNNMELKSSLILTLTGALSAIAVPSKTTWQEEPCSKLHNLWKKAQRANSMWMRSNSPRKGATQC